MMNVGGIRKIMVLWQAVFLAASPLVTAMLSNLTRLYYNGSAAKSHSTTTQYRQLRRLCKCLIEFYRLYQKGRGVGFENQTFRGCSLFLSGLKQLKKSTRNVMFKLKSKQRPMLHAHADFEKFK